MRRLAYCASAVLFLTSTAFAEVVVLGGTGSPWEEGGGGIQAKVIRGADAVESTNTPGGVIDFSVEGYDNWIFPQRADPDLNIAVGSPGAAARSPLPPTGPSATSSPGSSTTTARRGWISARPRSWV